jgi:hypothetical protein
VCTHSCELARYMQDGPLSAGPTHRININCVLDRVIEKQGNTFTCLHLDDQ